MFLVFGFYKFKRIFLLKKMKLILHKEILEKKIRGTIILAPEGINGTISGSNEDCNKYLLRRIEIINKDTIKNLERKILGYYDYY